ncbi:MAG: hypothetical protein AMXMBFR76_18450 [Pseudomonadota bacterium]|jgi:membrane protein required for colicin V production
MVNPIDVLILVVVAISLGIALLRGLVQEALSLATWFAAAAAGYWGAAAVQPYLSGLIAQDGLRHVVAGVLVFAVVLILGGLINRMMGQTIRRLGLGGVDRLLGMVFGAARATALITLAVMLAQLTPLPRSDWWARSALVPYFLPLAARLQARLPADVPTSAPAQGVRA